MRGHIAPAGLGIFTPFCYFLMFKGFDMIANMEGGISKWARKGFPVKGDPSSLEAAAQSAGGCC